MENHQKIPDSKELNLANVIDPSKKPKENKYALACALLASMTSILLGYDGGVMSGAIIYIQPQLRISDVEKEILMSAISICSLLGAAIAGRTSDWLGRRNTVIFASAIFFAGALLMGFATNYAFLMAGRFVAGVGTGYGLMIAPVYTAELSPKLSRGFLTSFPEVFINFGVLLGYVSNYAFSKLPVKLGWRLMLGVGAIPSLLLGLGVLLLPESPRWLVMQGRLGDARKVLAKISDSEQESEDRLAEIKENVGIPSDWNDDVVTVPKRNSRGAGVWKEMFIRPTPKVRHIVIAALGIQLFQQASGIDSVVLYSPTIFEKAGLKKDNQKLLATIGVGISKTSFILVATFLLDKVGRRVLLLTSAGGLLLSLLGIATGLTLIDHYSNEKLTWAIALSFACTLSSVAFFSIGMGPIAWVYSSEIWPQRLRAQGCSIGVAVNRLTSGTVTMTFISLYKAIGIGGSFYLYSGIAAVSWIFFYTLLPETRGRSLEEMDDIFGTFFRWRSTMKELNRKKEQELTSFA